MSDGSQWGKVRLGEVADLAFGATPSRNIDHFWDSTGNGFPWVSIADLRTSPVYKTAEKITRAGVRSSSVHLVKAGTPLMSFKLTIGRVAVAGLDLYTNEAIVAVNGKTGMASNRWLFHSLPGIASGGVLDSAVKGSTLNKHKLEQLELQLPSLPEQCRIAEILDTADEAIQSTERLVAKFEQARQGLLRDLLTWGTDWAKKPHHFEKDTGSRYNSLPPGWSIATLGQVAKYVTYGFTNPMPTTDDGPWLLTAADIGYGYVNLARARHTSDGAFNRSLTNKSRPKPGDILITKDGTLGRVAKLRSDGVRVNQSVAVVRLVAADWADYVVNYLLSPMGQDAMLTDSGGSTIKHLYITKLAKLPIPFPPKMEADRIVDVAKQWESVQLLESERLEKLHLVKQGLMNDLLTGRIRVGARA